MSTNPRIGVEIEILPIGTHRPSCPDWTCGTDGPNVEYRTSSTVRKTLDSFTDHVGALMEVLNRNRDRWELNNYTGFHVHINTQARSNMATTRLGLIAAYQHMFDEARSLVEVPEWRLGNTRRQPYNSLIDVRDYWKTVRMTREFVPNSLGTMELRLWDTTFDMDLIAMRHSFLRRLVALAEEINTEEARQLLYEGVVRYSKEVERQNKTASRWGYTPQVPRPERLVEMFINTQAGR